MTPVIWKIAGAGRPCAVYCLNPRYDLDNDYRLRLIRHLDVPVEYIYNQGGTVNVLSVIRRLCVYLFLKGFQIERTIEQMASSNNFFLLLAKRGIAGLAEIVFSKTRKLLFNTNWADAFIRQANPSVLCFDWVRPKNTVVKKLLQAARKHGIRTLALPHGVFVYKNKDISVEEKILTVYEKLKPFSAVVVQNKLFRDFMVESGLEGNKIHVLGSSRYCNEWVQENLKILPRSMNPQNNENKKLKVVFMTTKLRYKVDGERLQRTISRLATDNALSVIVKPHTRTGEELCLYNDLPLKTADDISSVELCEWADVVMVIASSIILEAIAQKKPVLYLKYLHANETIYEEYNACWTINTEDELIDALQILKTDPHKRNYTQESEEKFMSDIVGEGVGENRVLDDYAAFIINAPSGS